MKHTFLEVIDVEKEDRKGQCGRSRAFTDSQLETPPNRVPFEDDNAHAGGAVPSKIPSEQAPSEEPLWQADAAMTPPPVRKASNGSHGTQEELNTSSKKTGED